MLVTACAGPGAPAVLRLYDFGAPQTAPAPASGTALPAVALRVQASSALDSPAMLYRLAYADARQLQSYAQARWALPPAELLQQRVREQLAVQQSVLAPGQGAAREVLLEVQEFSQVFSAAQVSAGVVRLQATVWQVGAGGRSVLAQRTFSQQRAAPSPDAAGGVQALDAASRALAEDLAQWLGTLR